MDASPGGSQDFPIYPEAKMRHALWAHWLPEHSDRDAAQGSRGRSREVIFNLRINIWSGVTWVPDEIAHGSRMELVAVAGLVPGPGDSEPSITMVTTR